MEKESDVDLIGTARKKMQSGALMAMNEVSALLGVAPRVVHKLPLPGIRLGRALRFDPADVRRLLATYAEPAIPFENAPHSLHVVFCGTKYHQETDGAWGHFVGTNPMQRVELIDILEALDAGKTVTIAPASPFLRAFLDADLEQFKATQAKKQSDESQADQLKGQAL